MDKLREIVNNKDILYSKDLPSINTITSAETKLDFKFGKQLRQYLMEFGFLYFPPAELYGINEKQQMRSDLISNTLMLRETYPQLNNLIVLEDRDDGNFICCDSDDNILNFIPAEQDEIIDLKTDLEQYLLNRIDEIM